MMADVLQEVVSVSVDVTNVKSLTLTSEFVVGI